MPPFNFADPSLKVVTGAADGLFELVAGDGTVVARFSENEGPCDSLRAGAVPEPARALCAALLDPDDARIATARAATARRMWPEFTIGWQHAPDTDPTSEAAFAAALGTAEVELTIDPDGTCVTVGLCWANKTLFAGHSVFTDIYDPHQWTDIHATLFG